MDSLGGGQGHPNPTPIPRIGNGRRAPRGRGRQGRLPGGGGSIGFKFRLTRKPDRNEQNVTVSYKTSCCAFLSFFLSFFFFFGYTCGMQKFPGQGLNLSHSSDNTESLTPRPPGNSCPILFKGLSPSSCYQEALQSLQEGGQKLSSLSSGRVNAFPEGRRRAEVHPLPTGPLSLVTSLASMFSFSSQKGQECALGNSLPPH